MLTQRQKDLYEYLLENRYHFESEFDIAYRTELYGKSYKIDELFDKFHDSTVRHQLTRDIRAINESGEVDKIIISTSLGIKIATEEEFKQYIDAEFAAIFRKLKRTYAKAKKANLDGQYNFKDQVIEVFY